MGELEGQVALVTGAAGAGIGQACARRLAQEGATVALTDVHERRTREVSEALGKEFGEQVRGYVLDVADRAACDRVIAEIERGQGPIDILVNNAAINILGPVSEYRPEDWDRVLDVDLTALRSGEGRAARADPRDRLRSRSPRGALQRRCAGHHLVEVRGAIREELRERHRGDTAAPLRHAGRRGECRVLVVLRAVELHDRRDLERLGRLVHAPLMASLDLARFGLVPSARRPALPGPLQRIDQVLASRAALDGEREALVGRFARYSYAALEAEANRSARQLERLGIGRGDRVAASLGNHSEIVVAFLGAMKLGAIWVGINRPLAPSEKVYMLADCEAKLFLGDHGSCAQVAERRAELGALEQLLSAEPGDRSSDWARGLAGESADPLQREVDPFAPAAIAYTSGTTGFPKGAVHSQHNLLLPGALAAGAADPGLRMGVCLPLSILNLMILGPLLSFQCGGCCVAMDRIDAPGIAAWVREERIVTFSAVPAILHDLLTHPDVKLDDLATLTRPGVGGANCPESTRRLFEERFGYPVGVGYGLTEAPTAVTRSAGGAAPREGSAGRALPHVEIVVVDEQDRPLPPGEPGEVCVAPAREGPWAGVYTPMLGYWNQPEASDAALRGGLLHTGDLGVLDAQGELAIRDRKSDLILRGGANVYPAEVERVLHEDPRVAACAVLGRPDPRLGERVVAVVQLEPGARASAEELLAHCRAELARYKVPDEIRFLARLPRTPMGKIRKLELGALFA
jgi:acyl-CoA synthetase (AMP-forming)/AMP-acid ligase II